MSNRLLIGKDQSGEFTFKLSRPGIDVLTAAPKDLLINSGISGRVLQKIYSGTVEMTGAGGTQLVTWPNPDNFKPFVIWRARRQYNYYYSSEYPKYVPLSDDPAGGVGGRNSPYSMSTIQPTQVRFFYNNPGGVDENYSNGNTRVYWVQFMYTVLLVS